MKPRTSLVTVAAVAGTLLVGSAVVAANVGILNAADDNSLGELTAAATVETTDTVVTTIAPQVVDIYVQDPPVTTTAPTTTAPDPMQEFKVDSAGTVRVGPNGDGIGVASVTATEGWLWNAEQPDTNTVVVTFASSDSTFVFTARMNPDGSIEADVEQPIVNIVEVRVPSASTSSSRPASTTPATTPATTAPAPTYSDDDHEDHEDEDHDREDDDHDYEGGSDDD